MRYSVWLSTGWTWDETRAVAVHADGTGWDGIWVPDHFMPPEGGYGRDPDESADPELRPVHEGWTFMTAIAAVTSTARVGVLVSGNTYRHPAVLAKMGAALDHVSHGRAVLGLGAGWQENEHRRYGIEYGTPVERSDWLEEAAAVVTSLLTETRSDFDGERYSLEGAPLEPKPLQDPLPLMIGGGGEQRTMRTAAMYAQEWNIWATPERLAAKGQVLDQRCEEVGRDPSTIDRSAATLFEIHDDPERAAQRREHLRERAGFVGTPDEIRYAAEAYREAGADEVVVAGFGHEPGDLPGQLDRLRRVLGI